MTNDHGEHDTRMHDKHGRPYLMFWVNMALGLVVMYVVMFVSLCGAITQAQREEIQQMEAIAARLR